MSAPFFLHDPAMQQPSHRIFLPQLYLPTTRPQPLERIWDFGEYVDDCAYCQDDCVDCHGRKEDCLDPELQCEVCEEQCDHEAEEENAHCGECFEELLCCDDQHGVISGTCLGRPLHVDDGQDRDCLDRSTFHEPTHLYPLPCLARNDEFDCCQPSNSDLRTHNVNCAKHSSHSNDWHVHPQGSGHFEPMELACEQQHNCTIDPALLHGGRHHHHHVHFHHRHHQHEGHSIEHIDSPLLPTTSSTSSLRTMRSQDSLMEVTPMSSLSSSLDTPLQEVEAECEHRDAKRLKREDFQEPAEPVLPVPQQCRWRVADDHLCGETFSTLKQLKKHIKETHVVQSTTACGWDQCQAKFNTAAALSCHVSKKHCSTNENSEGLYPCTFPGCTKSFMYKQVRDEHVASHNGTKSYCSICNQWFNAEGSNFQKHMALHKPKHEHKVCKYAHLGCKRRFPRTDNLRRHEGRCKFGKRLGNRHCQSHGLHEG